LSLCFNWAPRHEGGLGEWRYRSIHSMISALDGGERSPSRTSRFNPRERAPGTHWIGGWVCPEPFWTRWWREKFQIPSPRQESNPRTPFVHPVAQTFPKLHSNIIFPSTPRSSKWFLPFTFSNENIACVSHVSNPCCLPSSSYFPWFYHPNNSRWSVQVTKLLIIQSSPASHPFHPPSYVQVFSCAPCSQTLSIYVLSLVWEIRFHTHTKQQVKLWFCMLIFMGLERRMKKDFEQNGSKHSANLICY
jgi:hypothetical protein